MKIGKIFESLLGETSRKTINDINDLILIKKDTLFLIYNPIKNEALGYISFGLTDGNVYSIYGAYANHGYGPLLYEMVMTYVYPKGITMSDDSGTSQEAMNVWKVFYNRTDVKKEHIDRLKKSEKELDLINGCNGDKDCLKWVSEILFLHNTKFIYSFGKPILDGMIKNGEKYLLSNPDLNIQDMIYGLEG